MERLNKYSSVCSSYNIDIRQKNSYNLNAIWYIHIYRCQYILFIYYITKFLIDGIEFLTVAS